MNATVSTPRLMPVETEVFGVRIANTTHTDSDTFADEQQIDCMCLRLPIADTDTIATAEENGYRLTDIRVELERRPAIGTMPLATARQQDTEALVDIARTVHDTTRFYADPRFDRERCANFYETWIRNSLDGWANDVLVIGAGRTPQAYVTLHHKGDHTRIGLIAVAEEARRRGVGASLLSGAFTAAVRAGSEKIRVATQGRNVQALRLFEHAGFETIAVDVWLHKHYDRR